MTGTVKLIELFILGWPKVDGKLSIYNPWLQPAELTA